MITLLSFSAEISAPFVFPPDFDKYGGNHNEKNDPKKLLAGPSHKSHQIVSFRNPLTPKTFSRDSRQPKSIHFPDIDQPPPLPSQMD
jgi:hypothetical protein